MCGIVGAVAERDISAILLEGLKRLEYRGYDSAGVAIIDPEQSMQRIRTEGKVCELENALQKTPLKGQTGIAHTRWATHGKPCEANAHPHTSQDEVALVHNGIIENHEGLRKNLIDAGYAFSSETDSETIAHLIHQQIDGGKDFLAAVQEIVPQLEGAFALGIIHSAEPGRLIAVRSGSPLVIGIGIGEHFVASDQLALVPVAEKVIFLEEGDMADVYRDKVVIYNKQGKKVKRKIHILSSKADVINRGAYRHYMQKEIFEQPDAVSKTLEGRISNNKVLELSFGEKATKIFDKIKRVQIVACGTSYHAGMVGRYWLEAIAGIPCQVEVASENRYRKNVVEPSTLLVVLSQSGETADTLAALRAGKKSGYKNTLAICNVPSSSIVRESDLVLMTRAGTEIGVASTKAFTTQLVAMLLLTLVLGRRHNLSEEEEQRIASQLISLPAQIENILSMNDAIEELAEAFADKQHTLFVGRNTHYPIALEGALKLKEISYIHAEAYPAGELKHGPLALVDKDMPVVAVAPNDDLLEKLKSNLQEVRARGGQLIVFADGFANLQNDNGLSIIEMPSVDNSVAPIAYTVPLQLLAYHVAVLKGTDVDQPRNLAKSVTVE